MTGETIVERSEAKNDEALGESDKGAQNEPSKEKRAAEPATPPATSELPPEIKQKLRKLEKLEATYPGRLSVFHPRV